MGNQTSYVNEQVISMDGKLEDNLECIGSKFNYGGEILKAIPPSSRKYQFNQSQKQSHSGQRHDINTNEHNDRKKVNHPNILQYYGCQSNYLTFKGNILQTKFFFEYVPNTLDNVISFHKKNCSYLEESEIWKIIQQIVSACSFLEKLDLFHGDLNPQTIFIDNSKQIKILYHNAYPDIITSYAKLLAYSDASVYISPQQLDSLATQSVDPTDDPQKTDSFQFGLTLLEIMTMTSILEDCIDYQRKTIYYKSIMDLLSSARKRYSQHLIDVVQRLITFDEQSRPKLSDFLYDTNLQSQQSSSFLPQSKIRRYTSPPKQPERTNSPPPDMGFSSKSPVQRDLSIQSQFRTPLQRSVSPILDRSTKYLNLAQSRNTTALSVFHKSPNKPAILIQSQTPIKNDRGRKLNTVTDNSRNVLVVSRSPIQNQSRKASAQYASTHQPALTFVTPRQYTNFLPVQQESYSESVNQKQLNQQQYFSQTLQHYVQPYHNNQENFNNTLPKPQNIQTQLQQQQSIQQQPQSANALSKTPQKVPSKGINLLSPLQSINK